ncbi:translational elongation factor EF-1 alpha [Ceratobasidium sp. 392]|nr:translational elongation factor EF-1 alpha [Ceratobasidium sp. 392]
MQSPMAPAALAPAPAAVPSPAAIKAAATGAQFDTAALFGAAKAAREEAAATLAAQVKADGPSVLAGVGFVPAVVAALNDKKSPAAREGACAAISVLCEKGAGKYLEPYVVDSADAGVFRALLEAFADKMPGVRTAALDAVRELVQVMNPWAAGLVLPALLHQIKTAGKWQVKTGSLAVLNQLIVSAPDQMAKLSPDIIPVLAEAIWDTKADVKKAARETLTKATALVSNKDIEKFIPALINALINPVEEVPKTIQLLSATTFVSEVDAPTLSLMVPLLSRGLTERLTATKRKVAVIIDNMAKLVDNEFTVRPFIPKLLPGLIKISESVADPEARGVVVKAIATLRQVGKIPESDDGSNLPEVKTADPTALAASISQLYKKAGASPVPEAAHPAIQYAARLSVNLLSARNFDVPAWEGALVPYLELVTASPEPVSIARELLLRSANDAEGDDLGDEDDNEGEDLCNCQFSLAYGAKILLNTATLRLKRGNRYGLCGRNGSGKSTLMRAITNGQVEGFPSPDEVRTFYVEHDIDGSDADTSVLQFILQDKRVLCDQKEVIETLESLGFTDERQGHAIGSLSGGWKMKLALARAMLFKADILLLDEPTNHLDVVNVAWLESYLTSLKTCTSIIVSHDSGFLNNTITDVWKHPNLVIGYVAQHAFHHIDHHLDKTPLEYMLWRYQTGEDLEEMSKANRQISADEEKKMKEGGVVLVEGVKRLIDEIVSRKKLKQSYEYEISFKNMSSTENIWLPRDELIKRGFEKALLELDTREAQRLGLLRPLVRREIEKHFADFGLEPEFVSHNTMRGLSGGQKVKIVLGAATWRRPHVICLDEPTNYLDRESLAALIEALKVFEGGVLVITHNRDFSESLCKEVWAMRDGRLEASGHNWVEGQGSGPRIDKKEGEEEDQYDAMGNKVDKAKGKKKLTSNEARKAKKDRMARRKRGEEVFSDEE